MASDQLKGQLVSASGKRAVLTRLGVWYRTVTGA